jgi:cytidylate kinase
MAVITLARQVGSGGQTVARLLADQLGYRAVGRRELVAEAEARGLRLPVAFADFADEQRLAGARSVSALHVGVGELEFAEALRGGAAPAVAVEPISFLEALAHERRNLLLAVASLVFALAADDRQILVGAGAQYLLAGLPGVLRIKTVAPAEVRALRLADAYGLERAVAREAVRQGDREQRDYNRAVFDADWDDPLHWDLTLNTELLTPEAVCATALAVLGGPGGEPAIPLGWARALAEAGAINRIFAGRSFGLAWPFATPSVDGVLLQGDVATADDANKVLAVARRAIGGGSLVDRLTVAGRSVEE